MKFRERLIWNNKILFKIIVILALVCSLFFGGKFGWQKLGEVKTEKSSAIVFRELQKCAELAVVKNTYSDIISIKKTRIAGLAKTYRIVKYTGLIRGGISDISKAKISVSNRRKSVKVELPPVEVLSNDISSMHTHTHAHTHSNSKANYCYVAVSLWIW